MRITLLTTVLIGALALTGCATGTSTPTTPTPTSADTTPAGDAGCNGVMVVVDFGTLDGETVETCVDASGEIAASAALEQAEVVTEGSVEWGDQIVCRVNDRPAADETVTVEGQEPFVESCQSMPPAFAYWSLWVKQTPDTEWEYAQEGLSTLQTGPGQSVGLIYTTGTETPTPGS